MIFWTDNKAILFLADFKFAIEDTVKIQPFFVNNGNEINHQDISLVISSKESNLDFFVVYDSEEGLETKEKDGRIYHNKFYRFFLRKYYSSNNTSFNALFLAALQCEPKHTFIRFSDAEKLRDYELKPFGTVLPIPDLKCLKYNYLKQNITPKDTINLATWIEKNHNISVVVEPNSTIVKSSVSLDFLRNNSLRFISEEVGSQSAKVLYSKTLMKNLNREEVELKSGHEVVFTKNFISDEDEKFYIKKGIGFFFEALLGKNTIAFNYTNFLRSSKPITELNIKEPIDHKEHQFVNIATGIRLPKSISEISKINHPENYFETFTNTDVFDIRVGKIRFSQKAFHFEQTNLKETVHLISKFKDCLNGFHTEFDLEKINDLEWQYAFVKRARKLIFHSGELHYTSSKGLHHSGVLQIPANLKLQMLVSKKAIEVHGINRIIDIINESIVFLYKDSVAKLTEDDVLIFDYNDFKHTSFSGKLSIEASVLTYLIDPGKSSYRLNYLQIEKTTSINQEIIGILEKKSSDFSLINDIDKYVFANAILKMGLRKGAVPWKLDSIDKNDSNHIFIGIDLGHNHQTRKSNLTLTAINNQGCIIDYAKMDKMEMNEQIPINILQKTFQRLFKKIQHKNLIIQRITIHRDGRYFESISEFTNAVKAAIPNVTNLVINLVEVIKNEVPLIGFKCNENYLDSFEGLYFLAGDTSYLITNDQSLNTKTAPKPLKIRKVAGEKKIEELTEEIYWLTKPYSINLFMPSKLPITTLLANNLSYSKVLNHFISA